MTDLLDSKRFCAFMDGLAAEWTKLDDNAKGKRLGELKGWLDGQPSPRARERDDIPVLMSNPPQAKRKGGRPRGSKNVPKLPPVGGPELKPDEAKHYLALANQAQRDAPNVPEKMDRFMQSYVVPALKNPRRGPDGMIWINLPDSFEGRPLPSSNKVWSAALGRIGINKEVMEWGAGADGMSLDAAGAVSQRILKL